MDLGEAGMLRERAAENTNKQGLLAADIMNQRRRKRWREKSRELEMDADSERQQDSLET